MANEEVSHRHLWIEPLTPAKHERKSFSSGISRIDNFLKLSAKKQQAGDFTRVWVAVSPESQAVLGYYAINAHAIEAADLPSALTKNAPQHGRIPAAYLSMIGVDRRHQGAGLGRILLADALKRIAVAADQLGIVAVILDVLEDGGPEATERRRTFYEAIGFQPFPSRRLRMFISIKTVNAAFTE